MTYTRHQSGQSDQDFAADVAHSLHVATDLFVFGLCLVRSLFFFSSPEPSGSQGELIVYPCSGVLRRRPSVVHNVQTYSPPKPPIKAKFYMEPPWEGGTKVCINDPGHITKMAAMSIYGKTPSEIFASGAGGLISTKLGM